MSLPTFADFEQRALAEGFDQVLQREWDPGAVAAEHTHPFAVKAVMVRGDLWLTCSGETRHLRAGDSFEIAHGAPHAERYGHEGATFWAARRHQA